MRTSEERVQELHRRMRAMEDARNRHRYRLVCAAACSASLAISIVMAVVIANLPIQAPGEGMGGAAASIFVNHAALGYVVVALLAFCLGTLVTIFCFRIKKHMKEKGNDDRTL